MKKFSGLVSVIFLLGVAATGTMAAKADDKGSEKVTIAFQFPVMGSPGSFAISGAVSGSGPVEYVGGSFFTDDGVEFSYSIKDLHLAGGDILLYQDGPFTETDTEWKSIGTWHLLGGTGLYNGITGNGTQTIVADAAGIRGDYRGRMNVRRRDRS